MAANPRRRGALASAAESWRNHAYHPFERSHARTAGTGSP